VISLKENSPNAGFSRSFSVLPQMASFDADILLIVVMSRLYGFKGFVWVKHGVLKQIDYDATGGAL